MDTRTIPLGAPVFLSTTFPLTTRPLQRLVLAQDTGGPIRGAVHADFFWGFGDAAGREAGRMRQDGRMWLHWPKDVPLRCPLCRRRNGDARRLLGHARRCYRYAMDPVVLFFLLGVFAKLAKSDLRLPEALYETLSIFLLLAIGLKGGVELAKVPFGSVALQAAAVLAMGFLLPLPAFAILRGVGRLSRPDAASIAAHYGSVSVVTFAVATAFLTRRDVGYEAHMPLLVALLETPAIVTGILLARLGTLGAVRWGAVAHEVLLGKSLVLLLGGIVIGAVVGPEGIAPVKLLFFDLFKGVLALFLLEMGLVAGGRVGDLRRAGPFLVAFGVIVPLAFACIGAAVGRLTGLSDGGTALLATMAASASYIAVPTAMRIAVPEANPALSIGASLGVTFPFNITVGIPLYLQLAQALRF